jgi:hypothetical protein
VGIFTDCKKFECIFIEYLRAIKVPEEVTFSLPVIVDSLDHVIAFPHIKYYHQSANFTADAKWIVRFPIPRDFNQTAAKLVVNKIKFS